MEELMATVMRAVGMMRKRRARMKMREDSDGETDDEVKDECG